MRFDRRRLAFWAALALTGMLLIWWSQHSPEPLRQSNHASVRTSSPADAERKPEPGSDFHGRNADPDERFRRSAPDLSERADSKRRSSPPSRPDDIAARTREKLLNQLEAARSVDSMQAALVSLLESRLDPARVRAALDIMGRQPEDVQRQVFSVLRDYRRPDWERILLNLVQDPSPYVAGSAAVALEEMGKNRNSSRAAIRASVTLLP